MRTNVQRVDLDSGDALLVTAGAGYAGTPEHPMTPSPGQPIELPVPPDRETIRAKLEEIKVGLQPRLDELRAKLDELRAQAPDAIKAKIEEIKNRFVSIVPPIEHVPGEPGSPGHPIELPPRPSREDLQAWADAKKEALATKAEEIKARIQDIKDNQGDQIKDKVNEILGKLEGLKQALHDRLAGLSPEHPIELPPPPSGDRLREVIDRIKARWQNSACGDSIRQALDDLRAQLGSPSQPIAPEPEHPSHGHLPGVQPLGRR